MSGLEHAGLGWISAGCFALTVISAMVPWVNAEVIVLSLPALAPSRTALIFLVLVATAGQMTGKLAVYWAGRGSARTRSIAVERALERWRPRLTASRMRAAGFIVLSSAIGIPPFFVATLVAGALRMDLGSFFVAGTCGRLMRFGALALVPQFFTHAG